MDLKGRNFLTLKDFTPEEITYLLDLSAELKEKKKKGIPVDKYRGMNVALIFEKTSTRTRCSFEVAAHDMGMGTTYLDPSGSQIGKKESIEDTARVLGRMFDGIEYRGFGQDIVEDLQKYSGVPVWNGLTDVDHPTQVLADFMTMDEHIDKKLDEMRLTFVGDLSDNVMYALMYGSAIKGVDFKAVGQKETESDPKVLEVSQELAKKSGATITISHDPEDVKGSDVIYTDIWVSMGESEDLYPVRVKALSPYKVTTKMMMDTGIDKCLFMPADLTGGIEFNHDNLHDKATDVQKYRDAALAEDPTATGDRSQQLIEIYTPAPLNQVVNIASVYAQNEWKNEQWSFLIGGRVDKNSIMDKAVFSPRANIRYHPPQDIYIRVR